MNFFEYDGWKLACPQGEASVARCDKCSDDCESEGHTVYFSKRKHSGAEWFSYQTWCDDCHDGVGYTCEVCESDYGDETIYCQKCMNKSQSWGVYTDTDGAVIRVGLWNGMLVCNGEEVTLDYVRTLNVLKQHV